MSRNTEPVDSDGIAGQADGQAKRAPAAATCAHHATASAEWICARCGDYVCRECAVVQPQAVQPRTVLCRVCHANMHGKVLEHRGHASDMQRFINFTIDGSVGSIFGAGVSVVVADLWGDESLFDGPISSRLFGGLMMMTYYALAEGLSGRSLGKVVTGTRVLAEDGTKATLRQVLLRSLVRFMPFEAFSFLSPGGGWHDRWSHTKVVRTRGPVNWDANAESYVPRGDAAQRKPTASP